MRIPNHRSQELSPQLISWGLILHSFKGSKEVNAVEHTNLSSPSGSKLHEGAFGGFLDFLMRFVLCHHDFGLFQERDQRETTLFPTMEVDGLGGLLNIAVFQTPTWSTLEKSASVIPISGEVL